MRVMKFGGGCLRDAQAFIRTAEAISSDNSSTIVVVSAIYGMTNRLLEAAETALERESAIAPTMAEISDSHYRIAQSAIKTQAIQERALASLDVRLKRLERLLYGVSYTGELTDVLRLMILSYGERLSAILLAEVLNDREIAARSFDADSLGIITDSSTTNATANIGATRENLRRALDPLLKEGITPIVTGFFGRSPSGKITSFGRNGSDYSAALVARVFDAEVLEIWKDVAGFMTADPSLIPTAKSIARLSYREAAELSYFGARVLHPRTVEPLMSTNILIKLRNINDPDGPITLIYPEPNPCEDVIKSVTCNNNLSVLRVHGVGVGWKPGIIGNIGQIMSDAGINIYSVLTAQTCINLLVDIQDLEKSLSVLQPLVGGVIERIEACDDVALIAVVGEGLLSRHGLAARVFSAVAQKSINVEMFAAGASEVAYYFIVKQKDMEAAIQAVHEDYFG